MDTKRNLGVFLSAVVMPIFTAGMVSAQTTVGLFTGGDVGEGLDLDGTFVYAIDAGPSNTPSTVRDATFTDDDSTAGATVTAAFSDPFGSPNYGASANDDALEFVMGTIKWTSIGGGGQVLVDLAGLTPGVPYKLQMLFAEAGFQRGFDVFVEGALIADEFSPYLLQGGVNVGTNGAVITHTFVAADATLNIVLDGTTASFPDRNPILQAATLELQSATTIPTLGSLGILVLVALFSVGGVIALRRF